MHGHFTVGTEPKFWIEWEQLIMRMQVVDENEIRVGRMMDTLNDELTAFKHSISFVRWQSEGERVAQPLNRQVEGDFGEVLQSEVIGKT